MAIPCSSSTCRSLSYFQHSTQKPNKNPSSSSFKFLPFYSPPVPPWSKHHPFFINSSVSFTSSTLDEEEESSSSPSPSPSSRAVPLLELSFKSAAATTNSQYKPRNQTQNLNRFLQELLKDPKTQDLGLEMYKKAKGDPGFKPERSTINTLIKYLVRSKNWDSVPSVCNDLRKYNVIPDSITCSRLIGSSIKARKFKVVDLMLDVFTTCGDKVVAVAAFDAAMRGYNKLHMYSSTVAISEKLKQSGLFVLDPEIYRLVMGAYMRLGKAERVVELFVELEAGDKLDPSSNLTTQVYAILFEALGKSGKAFRALEYYKSMTTKGILPNAAQFSSLIGSFAEMGEVGVAEELSKEAVDRQMLKDPALFLKLVLMYVEEKAIEKTLNVVELMQASNVKVTDCIFCAIVNGFAKQRGLKSAADIYGGLIQKGIEPGQVTYASILNVYCRLGLHEMAESLFEEMEHKGYDRCVVAYSSMIVMYGKTGKLREAMKLVAKMKERGCEPNAWIYNALIDLHGRVKNLRQVEKIWKEMKRRKVSPDRVSYTSIIGAYSKAREYEKCVQFYQEYRLNGGGIDRVMAGIMVGVFSKSRVDELVKLLQDMKNEGTKLDARLYRSAFYALKDAGLEMQAKQLKETFNASVLPPVRRAIPQRVPVPQ